MAVVAAATSPFRCRWIQPGSVTHVSNWSLATCIRVRGYPRMVTEEECAHCDLWQAPDDRENIAPRIDDAIHRARPLG